MFKYDPQGSLFFSNLNLLKVIGTREEPLYLYSLEVLKTRTALYLVKMNSLFGSKFKPFFAVKSNSHPEILKFFKSQGFGADVVSAGEMKLALGAGFTGSEVIFSGTGKTKKEIEFALSNSVMQINVESESELKRICEIAKILKTTARVGLRFNPSVDPKTHPYIATGFKDNKFGLDESTLKRCLAFIKEHECLKLGGLSLHIGSQLTEFSAMSEAFQKTMNLLKSEKVICDSIDIGGGVGIDYEKDLQADENILNQYVEALKSHVLPELGSMKVFSEPGRFLVARCGLLLTQVQYIKKTEHKTFVICNSGMNHLIRPALYQAQHRIFPLVKRSEAEQTYDVVGPICESSDFLAKNRKLTKIEEGDWIAVADSGAYGMSMATGYNKFDLPDEVLV